MNVDVHDNVYFDWYDKNLDTSFEYWLWYSPYFDGFLSVWDHDVVWITDYEDMSSMSNMTYIRLCVEKGRWVVRTMKNGKGHKPINLQMKRASWTTAGQTTAGRIDLIPVDFALNDPFIWTRYITVRRGV